MVDLEFSFRFKYDTKRLEQRDHEGIKLAYGSSLIDFSFLNVSSESDLLFSKKVALTIPYTRSLSLSRQAHLC